MKKAFDAHKKNMNNNAKLGTKKIERELRVFQERRDARKHPIPNDKPIPAYPPINRWKPAESAMKF
eukprot:348053-Amphidinium_carterae.2